MAGDKHRRKGKRQEARIIASLMQQPKTVKQLATALGVCGASVSYYLTAMHADPRRVYVRGHETRHGSPAKIWAAGSGPDVEYVPQSRPASKISAAQRRERVFELLLEKPRTIRELGPEMHMVSEAAGKYVRELRRAGKVRIVAWRHPREIVADPAHGGDWAPVYGVGSLPDVPKPARESGKDRHARLQQDKSYRDARNAERRARYQRDKMIKQHVKTGPKAWFAALVGLGGSVEAQG